MCIQQMQLDMKNVGKITGSAAPRKEECPRLDGVADITDAERLRHQVKELQEDIDYGKKRENKLMFFLYVLKEQGFPISRVFQDEIRDIDTTRFSKDFDD